MNWYDAVMDSNKNPLRNLPPVQRFQTMIMLSMMWTSIFCASAGLWYWFGELLAPHLLIALGVFLTDITFRQARTTKTYRDQPIKDGTARYDDVWGA